ncbi:hypothetical protein K2173_019878 [Erythroxylum novogranatense]|uniref:BHLH domain-containing protein n=1 Tax=Erythroxylum novogranatense TaxID=1862640 RepID=A0AAV8SNE2_9ROSI|nr:hypothetical protein K2173_019878 [Erythroxylum novogranatense]
MNHPVPEWNIGGDHPVSYQKKPLGKDNEVVELLWRNGQVVLHSPALRKPVLHEQVDKHDRSTLRCNDSSVGSSNLIHEDETASWIHYPIEDSFEKELCSNFFSELPSFDTVEERKLTEVDVGHAFRASEEQPHCIDIKHPVVSEVSGNQMPPPKTQISNDDHNVGRCGKGLKGNSPQVSVPSKGESRSSTGIFGVKGTDNSRGDEVRDCSVMTVGSSKQVSNDPNTSRASSNGLCADLVTEPLKSDLWKVISQSDRGKTDTLEPTVTSSSGGSGSSFPRTCKQSTGTSGLKRKSIGTEESDCQSEDAELESAAANNPAKPSGSVRRSRAAEVHNLSERRRRDRINEKMKALQQLIPHCNKTDKASMLDEAIEYLKSLQMQLQVMWMGGGMATMMYPGVQHYMPQMGVGVSPPPMPSMQNAMQFARVPLVDQSMSLSPAQSQAVMCQNPMFNPVAYQNQISDMYAHLMGFHMQNAAQPMNMFRYGSPAVQQGQMIPPPSSGGGASSSAAVATDTPQNGKMS